MNGRLVDRKKVVGGMEVSKSDGDCAGRELDRLMMFRSFDLRSPSSLGTCIHDPGRFAE